MDISTNQKPTIYRNLYENTTPVIWHVTFYFSTVTSHAVFIQIKIYRILSHDYQLLESFWSNPGPYWKEIKFIDIHEKKPC